MSDAQIFQMIGLCFLAIGVGIFSNPKFIKSVLNELENSTVGMFYGGLISFTIGFLLVLFHNIWQADRSIVITLIGWLALLKGLMFLMVPQFAVRLYKTIAIDKYSSIAGYVILALGVILLYLGIFV